MTKEAKLKPLMDKSWELAMRKTVFVLSFIIGSYFLVIFATILFYVFFSILTNMPQEYPGMTIWQPFWILALFIGFLVSFFKAIIDIIDEKLEQTTHDVD